jgi:hypothetical protein
MPSVDAGDLIRRMVQRSTGHRVISFTGLFVLWLGEASSEQSSQPMAARLHRQHESAVKDIDLDAGPEGPRTIPGFSESPSSES